ncbi:tRNA lysidine(34) synthetase TilS [Solimonas variicoloris]|uniref:tRNA lysidine(34) synthetase TilS n=1 Tax=Solimonas variicoloris TaxID=254408 RepID=UPI000A01FB0C|nr:tRNA lysidine(34) synthetase TilS [Solimonas variicoloris]
MKLDLPALAPRARVWVAYSGGLDSTVLLHLLHAQGVPNLRAVHVHHGLQDAADDWARAARRTCRALGVPLRVCRVQVAAAHGEGPEAAARAARYAAFGELLRSGDLLVTAHHRDDQAETVLLRALRGTGIAGLAAMPALAPFGPARLWRPLLDRGRDELRRYAEAQQLAWIDDPHNADPRYARSYLRREIVPRLLRHWPQALPSLARLAARAAEAETLAAELAELDLARVRVGDGCSVAGLLALPALRRRNALYHAWVARGWPAPSELRLAHLDREVLRARADAQPRLRHEHGELRRYRDRLYWLDPLPPAPDGERPWPLRRRSVALPGGLGWLRLARAPAIALQLRFARGGERLRPAGDAHTRTLKQLCQAAGLPPWVRERMPLLYEGDELIAVAGYWRSARAVALGLDPQWETALPGAVVEGVCAELGTHPR